MQSRAKPVARERAERAQLAQTAQLGERQAAALISPSTPAVGEGAPDRGVEGGLQGVVPNVGLPAPPVGQQLALVNIESGEHLAGAAAAAATVQNPLSSRTSNSAKPSGSRGRQLGGRAQHWQMGGQQRWQVWG